MARATATQRNVAGAVSGFRPPPGFDSILVTGLANVRYLTGFTGSAGCVLVTQRRRLFFTDFRYRGQAERQVRNYATRIVTGMAASAAAEYAVKRRMNLGVLGIESAHLSQKTYSEIKKMLKGTRLKDAGGTVEALRAIKDQRETGFIREAAAIADAALNRLKRTRITGRTEAEIAWMLEKWMRQGGSETLPFDIIVASGYRSAMPHGVATDKVVSGDELVVIDLGARVAGYCSDITRTFSTGTLNRRQNRIFEIVRDAQIQALVAMSPGAECAAVDAVSRKIISDAGYGDDFGHALGHGVGLDAHEEPVLSARSKTRLAAGMVVTVEPGIYRPRVGGVRIEDTVAVTAEGAERLTTFPRELISLR